MPYFIKLLKFQSDYDFHTRCEKKESYADVEFPNWEQIVHAIKEVREPNCIEGVQLRLFSHEYPRGLEICKSDGERFAICRFDFGVRVLYLENPNCPYSDKFFYFLGDIGLPERFVFNEEKALEVIKYFYDFGEVDWSQSWIDCVDIERDL